MEYSICSATAGDMDAAWELNQSQVPNPGSMAFHERLGFSRAGTLETQGGVTKVAMPVKEIG